MTPSPEPEPIPAPGGEASDSRPSAPASGARAAPDPEDVARGAAEGALRRLEGHTFRRWRCGTDLARALRHAPGAQQDAWRRAVKERLRALLEAAWPDRTFDERGAEIVVEAEPGTHRARIVIVPVFVAGRYVKLVRGISQTVFFCRNCRGRGRRGGEPCADCAGTGRLVPEAVEDFVVPAIREALRGREGQFHGSGREDVDVRMLGNGRLFVVSVDGPQHRAVDPVAVAADVERRSGGRVRVTGLRSVSRAEAGDLTSDHREKVYRVLVRPAGDTPLPADVAERLAPLVGAALAQRTPQRVEVRRADLVRTRRVLALDVGTASPDAAELTIRTDPGTYVKELVSGDEGRTQPSVAGLLGVPCVCAELDVLATGGDDAADAGGASRDDAPGDDATADDPR